MTEQLSLADTPGLVRRDHRQTAQDAAAKVRTGGPRWRILARIVAASREIGGGPTPFGITDEELADDLALSPSTERPRRVELVRDGLVEAIPDQTRDSRYGRAMQLWRATDAGYALYAQVRMRMSDDERNR